LKLRHKEEQLLFSQIKMMKKSRRDFMRVTGMTTLGLASGFPNVFATKVNDDLITAKFSNMPTPIEPDKNSSIIGVYGKWASGLNEGKLPALSFRRKEFTNLDSWKKDARKTLTGRLASPEIPSLPKAIVKKQYSYDGLQIEELSWQLPYGPPTDAILLKPLNATGKLPGILAFHDHGGIKYFGTRKITRTSADLHPMMEEHQRQYYENRAWANELARQGYVVLVPDAFPFGSRRVLLNDVEPAFLRDGLTDDDPENADRINAYNRWASNHEHIMSKSLLSAGTTWAGVFFTEDKIALDILCNRPDVDTQNVGCGGLSGGGMRTVFLAGQDDRIKCAVCVGFMTTWKDFVLNKAYTHTWMTYVPLLPNEMDFPEILGLHAPSPTLVMNNTEDELFTLEEMKRADKILREIFIKAGATDRYQGSYYAGPHKFDKQMQTDAFNWFDKWLKQ
jgi:dienelactone hydrolase